ncbi:hypothetical protein MMC30_007262 [Trapelia coarctata]|nr:hypothetical protein [Trapelia coarctata]
MASATASSTPGPATPSPLRRSFTLPPKLTGSHKPQTTANGVDLNTVDMLFVHHTCRIVSFRPTLGKPRSRPSSTSGLVPNNEPPGTLPWASHTERTIAAGPLVVYQVHNSVAFLNSGRTVHPILPKSQCWCVDNETKFVLRIRDNSYYRIELPNNSPEDRQVADQLKEALAKVLQYERTPCPFKRGHTVELPELPETPTKLVPWKPKHRPVSFADVPAHKQRDRGNSSSNPSTVPSEENTDDETHEKYTDSPTPSVLDQEVKTPDIDSLKTPRRPQGLNGLRSVTAPAQLTFKPLTPSGQETETLPTVKRIQDPETASLASKSSVDSFHSLASFHSPISPLPPSPPPSPPSPPYYSECPSPTQRPQYDLGIDVPKSRQHKRDASELTVTAANFSFAEDNHTPTWTSLPHPSTPVHSATPPLINDAGSQSWETYPEIITPTFTRADPTTICYPSTPSSTVAEPPTALRHRRRPRAYSPLPPPSTLYSPQHRLSGHHLTSDILHKTCTLLLGPPIQLVALMLNIARKIAEGMSYQSEGYVLGDEKREMAGGWESEGEGGGERLEEDEMDDYGVRIGKVGRGRRKTEGEVGGSWEID